MANVRIKDLSTTASTTASDDFFGVDGATNGTRKLSAYSPTFGGNLTVSGTGTSSVAGNWLVGTTTDAGYKLQVSKTGASGYGAFLLNTAGGSAGDYNGVLMSAANSTTDPYYSGAIRIQTTVSSPNFQNPVMAFLLQDTNTYQLANVTEKMRIASSGNLLLGTTTDSANGKLQLATHTTSAGGIGFGTDSYFYRRGTGEFVLGSATNSVFDLDGSAGNTQGIIFKKGGVETARISTPGSSSSLLFYTGSAVTALTLASNQTATFASTVTANGDIVTAVNYVFKSLGHAVLDSASAKDIFLRPTGTTALTLDSNYNIVPGTGALATTATNGFIYLQTCAGAPTGVPTTYTGRVASIYDTTNNKLYIYNGGWKSVTLA